MSVTKYLERVGVCFSTVKADGMLDEAFVDCVRHLERVKLRQAVVHLVGNGGSASIVSHAQNDLVKACGFRALVYQDVPLLTAYANDHGYPNGYSDALSMWLDANDVLIAVSSSGQSPNILNAVRAAKTIGCVVVTCSGFAPDNPLRSLGNVNFYVPSSDYGQVELTHAALLHCLTDRLHVG